jgi:predicted ATPase/DNA-binding SARP family transcriptional activator/class 3 adenylate cyclase
MIEINKLGFLFEKQVWRRMNDIPAGKGVRNELYIQLLGGFAVSLDGVRLPQERWKSRRARHLVELLALAAGHRLHREQVMDGLWPDSDLTAAANNFHQTLYAARRALGPSGADCLPLEEGFLSLAGEGGLLVDVEQFEAAAVVATAAVKAAALAGAKGGQDPGVIQAALALYPGDLLPDDPYEEWTIRRREALRRLFVQLLLELACLHEVRGEYAPGVEALQRLLAVDPLHEEAHTALMRLYALNGQRQLALRQYQALCEALQAELEVEPGEGSTQVYEAIQSGRYPPSGGAGSPLAGDGTQAALPFGMVTFLFSDIEGSTSLWERQPQAMPAAVARHHAILQEAIASNGGVAFKVVGDQFQAAFRFAHQGVAAAVAAQQAVQAEAWPAATGPLRVRMGLHTGPAELAGEDYAVSHTLNRAARVMAAGYGGQVLLSQETAGLVERELPEGVGLLDLGEHQLKGLQRLEHLYQVVAPGLREEFPRLPSARNHLHNLPAQLTSFIGREQQIAEVNGLVRNRRLVTLTGSGGVGKTRLALKAAEGLLEAFPDGVFLVELAPLADPELVAQACLQALGVVGQPGVPITDSLVHYLGKKHLLLLLDNCEHLIAACTQLVDRLLKACPGLHVLATSREILSVPGETPYRLPSLEVPGRRALPSLAELAQVEAVRLFVERAAQVAPGLVLTAENAGSIAQIGQRLDGIPLAIELAASRVRMMSVQQVASRLDDTFRLLTGGSRAVLPRQQTLKAMIDWSYNLLSCKERLLMQHLSVFAGGWSLEAAEAICADGEEGCIGSGGWVDSAEVIDLLAQLVDKSLVMAEAGERETRYRMLETIRQYARGRLLEAGSSGRIHDRHLAYFGRLSARAEPHLRGKGMVGWLERFDGELDNVRAALEWSLRGNVVQGLQIMADLMWFWWIRGLFAEGAEWLRRLLEAEAAERGEAPLAGERALPRARGLRAYSYLSSFVYALSDEDRLGLLKESISILRQLGPNGRRELGISLLYVMSINDEIDLQPEEEQEMLAIFQETHERFYYSEYLWQEQSKAAIHGNWDRAEACIQESLAISREIEDFDGISSRASELGGYAIFAGDYTWAEALFGEAVEASQKIGNRWMEMEIMGGFVLVALSQGQYGKAAGLNEAALREFQELNLRFSVSSALLTGMIIAWAQGDYQQAARLGREVIEDYPEIPENPTQAYFYLGRVALAQGDVSQAEAFFRQATSMLSSSVPKKVPHIGGAFIMGAFLLGWAELFYKQGKLIEAARVLGGIADIYQRTRYYLTPRDRCEQAATLEATRAALGEAGFTRAWQAGQAMTLDQAIEYALNEATEGP